MLESNNAPEFKNRGARIMEFFLFELLILSSVGSMLLMVIGTADGDSEIRIPNLARHEPPKRSGAESVMHPLATMAERFDEAA